MREQEFKEWLKSLGMLDVSSNNWARVVQRIENDEKINLDEEFKKDKLKSLLELYTYTTQDERDNRTSSAKIDTTKVASLKNFFSAHKSGINHYRKFCEARDDFDVEEQNNDIESNKKAIIALEAHLQAALRANMPQFDPNLTIIDDGIERSVETGFIDILAKDKDGCFVVIELKAGTAKSDVMGQTLGYMADIAEEENAEVRGIIVAGDFHKRVRSAARLTPKIELISYRYNFDFSKETPKPLN